MKIALFGGTFDPPTITHEAIIASCLALDGIDQVWVMPSGVREDKPGMSSDSVRLELLAGMKRQMFDDTAQLVITDFEMQLPRPTETVATVEALRQAYPDHEFWFVFGADSYVAMPTWRGGADLQATLPLLVVERHGDVRPVATDRLRHIPIPQDILDRRASSTKVRQAVAAKQPIDHLVSDAVQGAISRLELYRTVQ